jgi:hypothetical protein
MILRTRISESGHAYSIEADPHICFASTVTTFDFALKERYDDSTVENLTLADRPFFAKVTKNEDFMGESLVTPVIHANPQGHERDQRRRQEVHCHAGQLPVVRQHRRQGAEALAR